MAKKLSVELEELITDIEKRYLPNDQNLFSYAWDWIKKRSSLEGDTDTTLEQREQVVMDIINLVNEGSFQETSPYF